MDAEGSQQAQGSLLLIQFARSPREGRVKTRMMPHLSAAEACALHCDLTRWTCRQLLDSALGEVELSVAGEMDHPLFHGCRDMGVARVSRQRGADLGERMYTAIASGLETHGSVILVGSDCPAMDPAYLRRAASALEEVPLVFGPAADGGYVLIGARQIEQSLFRDIPWGSGDVYARTRVAAEQAGLSWAALPCLTDIDRPEDLPAWERLRQAAGSATG